MTPATVEGSAAQHSPVGFDSSSDQRHERNERSSRSHFSIANSNSLKFRLSLRGGVGFCEVMRWTNVILRRLLGGSIN